MKAAALFITCSALLLPTCGRRVHLDLFNSLSPHLAFNVPVKALHHSANHLLRVEYHSASANVTNGAPFRPFSPVSSLVAGLNNTANCGHTRRDRKTCRTRAAKPVRTRPSHDLHDFLEPKSFPVPSAFVDASHKHAQSAVEGFKQRARGLLTFWGGADVDNDDLKKFGAEKRSDQSCLGNLSLSQSWSFFKPSYVQSLMPALSWPIAVALPLPRSIAMALMPWQFITNVTIKNLSMVGAQARHRIALRLPRNEKPVVPRSTALMALAPAVLGPIVFPAVSHWFKSRLHRNITWPVAMMPALRKSTKLALRRATMPAVRKATTPNLRPTRATSPKSALAQAFTVSLLSHHCETLTEVVRSEPRSLGTKRSVVTNCKLNEFSCGHGTHGADHFHCEYDGGSRVRACFTDRCWATSDVECSAWMDRKADLITSSWSHRVSCTIEPKTAVTGLVEPLEELCPPESPAAQGNTTLPAWPVATIPRWPIPAEAVYANHTPPPVFPALPYVRWAVAPSQQVSQPKATSLLQSSPIILASRSMQTAKGEQSQSTQVNITINHHHHHHFHLHYHPQRSAQPQSSQQPQKATTEPKPFSSYNHGDNMDGDMSLTSLQSYTQHGHNQKAQPKDVTSLSQTSAGQPEDVTERGYVYARPHQQQLESPQDTQSLLQIDEWLSCAAGLVFLFNVLFRMQAPPTSENAPEQLDSKAETAGEADAEKHRETINEQDEVDSEWTHVDEGGVQVHLGDTDDAWDMVEIS